MAFRWSDGSEGPVSRSFLQRADEAAFWEAWVGAKLAREGLYACHMPFTADGHPSHGTSNDLLVSTESPFIGSEADGETVEVKGIKAEFTCPGDYPFERVLVCSQNSWLRKWPGRDFTSVSFLFASKKTGAIIWLPPMTKVELGREITDGTRNETYRVVDAEARHLRTFSEFVDWVKNPQAEYPNV